MDIPKNFKHKPILGVDYAEIDEGDAEFLSLGRSTWDEEDISAKIWRYTGEKWSRQSEEIPLGRVLDLAILLTARITGQKSYLNEEVVEHDDEDFLNSFLKENMQSYIPRLQELRSLLNYTETPVLRQEQPNIFSFATSELSQDAMIAWLMSWADHPHQKTNPALHRIGKEIISLFTGIAVDEIHNVKVGRQWEHIDIWAEINDDTFLAIEDKTGTSIHSNQLVRYKELAEEYYQGKRDRLCFAYFKLENEPQSILNEVKNAGYKAFDRSALLQILNSYEGTDTLILDFRRHLREIEEATTAFRHKPVDQWGWYQWQGFYKELERIGVDVDSWGYVANPQGGFLGLWWHWTPLRVNENIQIYLQFEEKKLCVKICCENLENKSEVRDSLHQKLIEKSSNLKFPISRPSRFGCGTYMTIGVIDADYIFGPGCIDMDAISAKLKELEKIIENCARS